MSKESPNQALIVALVDMPGFDRNFQVWLRTNAVGGLEKLLYTSPDEGRPIGTERIIWASNSEAFLVVGSHFFTRKDIKIKTGESMYLLYIVNSGELQGNASQNSLPDIDLAAVKRLHWEEELF